MIVDLDRKWIGRGACKGMDADTFFTDHAMNLKNPTPKLQERWDKAKRICRDCPVLRECARDSLGEVAGIWGGLDPIQRKELRKTHGINVRRLSGPLKEEYAALAHTLKERKYDIASVARIIGVSRTVVWYLYQWHEERIEGQDEIPHEEKISLKAASGLHLENVSRTYGTTHHARREEQ